MSSALNANPTVETACPKYMLHLAGLSRFSVFNDTCFLFVTYQSLAYEDAQRSCQFEGGTLAMPKTKPVNDFLIQEMRRRGFVEQMWIGMHDRVDEGSWMWEDGSDAADWGNMNFFNGGLFGDGSDCMALDPLDGEWHDNRCYTWGFNTELHYICQYKIKAEKHTAKPNTSDDAMGQGDSVAGVELKGTKDIDDDDKADKDDSGDATEPPVDVDDKRNKGGVGNMEGPMASDSDYKGHGDTSNGVKLPKGKGDVNASIQTNDDVTDQGQGNDFVEDHSCIPFTCQNLDCGMDGYKLQDGCQICECAGN
ncbi:collectin-10 [Elysia marginata]|uniref:Collectin-10 n=1 Tax=Elysia marginata TaxID=1093978 RepID=A0AAV4EWX2_9GAST|nr:collectin-10 [Elysia marginata]